MWYGVLVKGLYLNPSGEMMECPLYPFVSIDDAVEAVISSSTDSCQIVQALGHIDAHQVVVSSDED